MDFKDWRVSAEEKNSTKDTETAKPKPRVYRSKQYMDYIEEQIHNAQERGEFDNLPGTGKPLNLDNNAFVGDKALGYNLLKSNGYAPREIELIKEIRKAYEKAETHLNRIRHQSRTLRSRRIPPFASEKRAFNAAVEKAAREYEQALRQLNRKILSLNLMAPTPLHQPLFQVEKLVQDFRDSCPLFAQHGIIVDQG